MRTVRYIAAAIMFVAFVATNDQNAQAWIGCNDEQVGATITHHCYLEYEPFCDPWIYQWTDGNCQYEVEQWCNDYASQWGGGTGWIDWIDYCAHGAQNGEVDGEISCNYAPY